MAVLRYIFLPFIGISIIFFAFNAKASVYGGDKYGAHLYGGASTASPSPSSRKSTSGKTSSLPTPSASEIPSPFSTAFTVPHTALAQPGTTQPKATTSHIWLILISLLALVISLYLFIWALAKRRKRKSSSPDLPDRI